MNNSPALFREIDFGPDEPGAVLQRKEKGGWHDYLVDGQSVIHRTIIMNITGKAKRGLGSLAVRCIVQDRYGSDTRRQNTANNRQILFPLG